MVKFEEMSLFDIFTWLKENDDWSKDWYNDELYPLIERRFKPKSINDLKLEMGLSYANI